MICHWFSDIFYLILSWKPDKQFNQLFQMTSLTVTFVLWNTLRFGSQLATHAEEMPTNLKETIIVLLISVCVVKSTCGQWSHNFSNRWEGIVISGKGKFSGKYVNVDRAMSQRFYSLPVFLFWSRKWSVSWIFNQHLITSEWIPQSFWDTDLVRTMEWRNDRCGCPECVCPHFLSPPFCWSSSQDCG